MNWFHEKIITPVIKSYASFFREIETECTWGPWVSKFSAREKLVLFCY